MMKKAFQAKKSLPLKGDNSADCSRLNLRDVSAKTKAIPNSSKTNPILLNIFEQYRNVRSTCERCGSIPSTQTLRAAAYDRRFYYQTDSNFSKVNTTQHLLTCLALTLEKLATELKPLTSSFQGAPS